MGFSPELLQAYKHAVEGAQKEQEGTSDTFLRIKPLYPDALSIETSGRRLNPAPPDAARFGRELTGEALHLEYRLRSALRTITPHGLDVVAARIVLDLVEAKEPITCVTPKITEHQRKFVWEPLVRAWWDGLGAELRKRFEVAAHTLVNEADVEQEESGEIMYLGYSRLLHRLCERKPFLLGNIYYAIEHKKTVFVPEGFTEGARAEWEHFLRNVWFARLTQEQHNKFSALLERQKEYIGVDELHKELALKRSELRKILGFAAKVRSLFDDADKHRKQQLEREIVELERKISEIESSKFVDEALDIVNSDLYVRADKGGVGTRAEEMPAKLDITGAVYMKLNDLDVNVPPVIEGWLLKAVAERAAQEMKSGSESEASLDTHAVQHLAVKHKFINEFGRQEIDHEALVVALESRLIDAMSVGLVRGDSLEKIAQEEPVRSLLNTYRESVSRLDKSTHQRDARISKFLSDMLAETEYELAQLGGSSSHKMIPEEEYEYVNTKFLSESPELFVRPRSALGVDEAPEHQLAHTERIVRDPEQKIDAIVFDFVRMFNPGKSSVDALRMKEEFMHQGSVYEKGSTSKKHFKHNGSVWVEVPVGALLEATQDPNESFGFHITVTPNPAVEFPGYLSVAGNGTPIYYEKRGETVHVWNAKDSHKYRYAGHFEGKKFVEHQEKTFAYVGVDGTQHEALEFDTNVYFGANGGVMIQQEDGWLKKVGTVTKPFESSVAVKKGDGTEIKVDLTHGRPAHYITPRGEVVKFLRASQKMELVGRLIES